MKSSGTVLVAAPSALTFCKDTVSPADAAVGGVAHAASDRRQKPANVSTVVRGMGASRKEGGTSHGTEQSRGSPPQVRGRPSALNARWKRAKLSRGLGARRG